MGDIVKVNGASRNTLKEHFRHLLKQGHLEKHRVGKGTWYVLSWGNTHNWAVRRK
jgi:hypothetical protein